jgi:hypothetical protein
MKKTKLLAIVMTAIIALTALPMTASAGTIEDDAQSIVANTTYKATLTKGVRKSYKVTVKEGKAILNINADISDYLVQLYDANTVAVTLNSKTATTGKFSTYIYFNGKYLSSGYDVMWDSASEKSLVDLEYSLPAGTYYIVFWRHDSAAGYDTLKFNLKSANTKTTATTTKTAGVQLAAKATAQLYSDETATYKSSNEKIVKVDGAGKVTAVAKGTAYVTITADKQATKVYFNVK